MTEYYENGVLTEHSPRWFAKIEDESYVISMVHHGRDPSMLYGIFYNYGEYYSYPLRYIDQTSNLENADIVIWDLTDKPLSGSSVGSHVGHSFKAYAYWW